MDGPGQSENSPIESDSVAIATDCVPKENENTADDEEDENSVASNSENPHGGQGSMDAFSESGSAPVEDSPSESEHPPSKSDDNAQDEEIETFMAENPSDDHESEDAPSESENPLGEGENDAQREEIEISVAESDHDNEETQGGGGEKEEEEEEEQLGEDNNNEADEDDNATATPTCRWKDLIEKGLLRCGDQTHRVEESLVPPPRYPIPIDRLEFPAELLTLLSRADIWRSCFVATQIKAIRNEDPEEGEDEVETFLQHQKVYQFRFPVDGIVVGVVMEYQEHRTQQYKSSSMVIFCMIGGDIKMLIRCHGKEGEEGEEGANETELDELIQALGLAGTTSQVQLVSGIFSKVFSHRNASSSDPKQHIPLDATTEEAFGLREVQLTNSALNYLHEHLDRKRQRTAGSSNEEAIVID